MKKDKIFEKVTAELHKYFTSSASVKHNQKLMGKSGIFRQIDVLIEDNMATYSLKIVVDCKYYSKKVDINDVGEVWDIVDDVRANLGVIVSNAGFTDGAVKRANELGRLKLCSILDLENKEFSINIALPVICEFRQPKFQFHVSGSDPNMNLYSDPKVMLIEKKGDNRVSSIWNEFLNMWNEDKISHDVGSHRIDFSPSEWRMLGPYGRSEFEILGVDYEVIPRFYLGLVPLVEGKGIVDIQEHILKTKGFTMDKIDVVDVEANWEKFEKLEDIKTKPFMHLVASDTFKPINIPLIATAGAEERQKKG